MLLDALKQIVFAFGYYCCLIAIVRFAGKRLAGQITTFDLIILISLGVTLQTITLQPGKLNGIIFLLTVFLTHLGMSRLAMRYPFIRMLTREMPRTVIRDGKIVDEIMNKEGLTEDEILAALRKQGIESTHEVKIGVIEETGHISAIKRD